MSSLGIADLGSSCRKIFSAGFCSSLFLKK
uniref:Uncharacterized protein n=1 Tax=Arundo donax TaxID=35708 RepID=A0A0A8YAX9_ARUDO